MTLNPGVPMSHRLILAVPCAWTGMAVFFLVRGTGFPFPMLVSSLPFWMMVLYAWYQRRKWRTMNMEEVRASWNAFDRAFSPPDIARAKTKHEWIARLMLVAFWVTLIAATIGVYKFYAPHR